MMEKQKYKNPITFIGKVDDDGNEIEATLHEFSEVVHDDGYVQFGDDDDLFELLFELYDSSPTNQSILTSVSTLIFGRGLAATDSDQNPEDFALVNSIFDAEELEKVSIDYGVAQNATMLITRTGSTVKATHTPVQNYRASYETDSSGKPLYYYYHTNWSEVNSLDDEGIETYDNYEVNPQSNESILYIRKYTPGSFFYSKVDYFSGLHWAECEAALGLFHITNIDDGFSGKTVITLRNGIPDDEQRSQTRKEIQKEYQGVDGQKVIVLFADDADTAPNIDNLNIEDIAKQFESTNTTSENKILRAHRITSPILVGLRGEGGLGNNAQELETAFALFNNMVILPKQQTLLRGINKVLRAQGINLDLYFTTLKPFEFMDVDMDQVSDQETERQTGVQAEDQGFKKAFKKFLKFFFND